MRARGHTVVSVEGHGGSLKHHLVNRIIILQAQPQACLVCFLALGIPVVVFARNESSPDKQDEGPGFRPGARDGIPDKPDYNCYSWADHAFFTMDKIDESTHTREMLAAVMKAAFAKPNSSDPCEVRGIAVLEPHTTGGYHLQGAVFCGKYHNPNALLKRARTSDLDFRGWKTEPQLASKAEDFRVIQTSGEPHHLNVLFHHVHRESDSAVASGKKKAGGFKSPWRFNDMVKYLVQPEKDKVVDEKPFYINCDEETVWHVEEVLMDFPAMVKFSRKLKTAGVDKGTAHEIIATKISKKDRSWMIPHVMGAFEASQPAVTMAYLPEQLRNGDLLHARPLQIFTCMFLEDGPCREGCGLYLQCPPGSGKTTTKKLMDIRYKGQIYIAVERASSGLYDRTALMAYDVTKHRIVVFNDVKGTVDRRGSTQYNHAMHSLFREITDGIPMPFTWAGQYFCPTPIAKVIINSAMDPPEDDEFLRRYLWVQGDGANGLEIRNPQILLRRGTPDFEYEIVLQEGVGKASDFEILIHTPAASSEKWRRFLKNAFQSWGAFNDWLTEELWSLETDPCKALERMQQLLLEGNRELAEALENEHDRDSSRSDKRKESGRPPTTVPQTLN